MCASMHLRCARQPGVSAYLPGAHILHLPITCVLHALQAKGQPLATVVHGDFSISLYKCTDEEIDRHVRGCSYGAHKT